MPILSNDENVNLDEKYGTAEATGWGYTMRRPNGIPINSPIMLQYTVLPLYNNHACNADPWTSPESDFITENMVCAGGEGQANSPTTCQGDSGGPLTVTVDGEKLLLGAVSFGHYACTADFAGVVTNLATAKMQDFVNEYIYENE